jgi:uncharacterized protein
VTDVLWILICAQIVLGATDTLLHHEFMERLAWRKSQIHELQLHGIRNLLYSIVFLALGLTEIYGFHAAFALLLLYGELIVTLKDFVEEDRTRKLPPSERVLHTVLALNYGAILMGVTPILWAHAGQPTGIVFAFHGVWTIPCVVAGFGTIVFGLRDLGASARLRRLSPTPASSLLPPTSRRNVLITGGTGFIGSRLVAALVARGDDVTVLTRSAANASHLPSPIRIVTHLSQVLDDARVDAIVNLAGQATAGGLWTRRYKRRLLRSRLDMTRNVIQLIARLDRKPDALVSGSAIGIYGVNPGRAVDETSLFPRDGSFSQRMCLAWERVASVAEHHGVRTVLLRTGLVLDSEGGPLGQMLAPFEYGVGGPFGDGRNWMSWISRDDLVRLIDHAIRDQALRGPLNGVAPEPERNIDFARSLGRALRRPAIIPLPAFLLKAALGDLAREILLGSQHVRPARALQSGFRFHDVRLQACLDRLVGSERPGDGERQRPAEGGRPVLDYRREEEALDVLFGVEQVRSRESH